MRFSSVAVTLALVSVAVPTLGLPLGETQYARAESRSLLPAGTGHVVSAVLKQLLGKLKLFGRDVEDFTDAEIAQLSELLQSEGGLQARGGVPAGAGKALSGLLKSLLSKIKLFGRDTEDLTEEEINLLAELLQQEGHLQARGGVPPGVGKALSGVLKSLLSKFKLFGRDVEELTEEEMNQLLAILQSSAHLQARGGVPLGTGKALSGILKSLLSKFKLFGRDVEDLTEDEINELADFLKSEGTLQARGGVPLGAGKALSGLLKSLLSKFKLFGRDVEELTEDEMNQLMVLLQSDAQLQARGGVPLGAGKALSGILKSLLSKFKLFGRDVEDLTEDEINELAEFLKSEGTLQARGGVPPGIGKAFGGILKSLLGKLKLFGRDTENLTEEDIAQLVELISHESDLQARGGVPLGVGKALSGILKSLLGKLKLFGRDVEDLSEGDIAKLVELLSDPEIAKELGKSVKREESLDELD